MNRIKLTDEDIETNGDGCDTWMIIHTTKNQEHLKKQILDDYEYHNEHYQKGDYINIPVDSYSKLKEKAEKWDKLNEMGNYEEKAESYRQHLEQENKQLKEDNDI